MDFHLVGRMPEIVPDYELMLYRIIQELLQNTVKHSRAKHVLVQINSHDGLLSIAVEDDGIGFDKNAQEKYNGIGLAHIESRIHSLKGNINITSMPGNGVSVYIEIDTSYLQPININ